MKQHPVFGLVSTSALGLVLGRGLNLGTAGVASAERDVVRGPDDVYSHHQMIAQRLARKPGWRLHLI